MMGFRCCLLQRDKPEAIHGKKIDLPSLWVLYPVEFQTLCAWPSYMNIYPHTNLICMVFPFLRSTLSFTPPPPVAKSTSPPQNGLLGTSFHRSSWIVILQPTVSQANTCLSYGIRFLCSWTFEPAYSPSLPAKPLVCPVCLWVHLSSLTEGGKAFWGAIKLL